MFRTWLLPAVHLHTIQFKYYTILWNLFIVMAIQKYEIAFNFVLVSLRVVHIIYTIFHNANDRSETIRWGVLN